MTAAVVPSEYEEQAGVVDWLELQDLRFTAIPNSTWSPSHAAHRRNRVSGLRRGFPDMIVLIPPHRSRDGAGHLLVIEMKKGKGGVLSPEQREWIASLNGLGSDNIESVVAHGASEAIEYLSSYLKPTSLTTVLF